LLRGGDGSVSRCVNMQGLSGPFLAWSDIADSRMQMFRVVPVDEVSEPCTDAEHRGGSVRSSVEVPVMGMERRGRHAQAFSACQLATG